MIHDPEVLILDEPTSGLDPNQIIEIREVIRQQGKEKTVLFSSHILQEVEAICDRVIIINKGTLVADDKLSNLQQSRNNIHVVIVKFKETVAKTLIENLKGVSKVEESQSSSQSAGQGGYRLHTTNPEHVRKQIIDLSVQQNLNIISLQSEEQSLEDIFRLVTN